MPGVAHLPIREEAQPMLRTVYWGQLQELQDRLLLLTSMVSFALRQSMVILRKRDYQQAQWLIDNDRSINATRYGIEQDCLAVIATQQPMARDMRMLAGILEIAGELERIGDYAKGIGRIVLRLPVEVVPAVPHGEIPLMCEKVIDMLARAQDAFLRQDVVAAYAIPREDDQIDELYNRFNSRILELIRTAPHLVDQANCMLWAAHNMERAGDRVTNICERTIYTATGEFVEIDALGEAV
jgi:phosphate transport system protein